MRALAFLVVCLLTSSSLRADEPATDAEPERIIIGTVLEESGTPLEGGRRIVIPKRLLPGDEGKDDSGDETIARWIRPVEGATVRWIGRMDTTETTDASGKFRLPLGQLVPDRRRVELWVTKPGEQPLAAYVIHRSDPKSPLPFYIHLRPAKELTVTVVDENNKPVEGAEVSFMPRDVSVIHGKTNAEGMWTGMIPANDPRGTIIARKSGIGFDYAQAERGKDKKLPPSMPDEVRLVLDGARALRVKVINMEGEPLEGIPVSPSRILRHPNKMSHVNQTVTLREDQRFATKTDSDGIAIIDWLPREFGSQIAMTEAEKALYVYNENTILPNDGVEELTLRLCPLETISGQVAHADGKPAEGITISASGRGVTDGQGSGRAATDANGRYELNLPAEQAYYIAIDDEKWTAPIQWPLVLRIDQPLENVDLTLMPATRLYGRVTAGGNDAPVEEVSVRAIMNLGSLPEELAKLAPQKAGRIDGFSYGETTRTNDNGEYELILAPGEYMLSYRGGARRGEDIEITIPEADPPAEIEKNFHLDRPLIGPLIIRVVDQEGDPVPHATLLSRRQASFGRRWGLHVPTETNEKGIYETNRELRRITIQATSPDKLLVGIAHVDATATETEIVIGPTTSANGILFDEKGNILANKELEYGIRIPYGPAENRAFIRVFDGVVTTDEEGRFTIEGIIPGEPYMAAISIGEHSTRRVSIFETPNAEPLDLGELKVNTQPYQPYVPPTPAERAAGYFNASPDIMLAERLETILGNARRMYTRPLVLIGRADDPAAIDLFRRFYEQSDGAEDKPSPSDLRWEFELIALDSSREDVATYAQEHGIPTGKNAPPILLALDEQSEIIARLPLHFEREPVLAPKPGMNDRPNNGAAQRREDELLSFLLEYKLPTRDAQVMLDEAFATAAAQNKNVFLICSASWCGPCRTLAKFLEPHHEELETHYVFVHLDVSRDTHARDINNRYKGERPGGVPWYVILDDQGEELISSNKPAEEDEQKNEQPEEESDDEQVRYKTTGPNIGAIGRQSIDHFLNMLETTAPEINPELLKTMREELEEE